MQLFKILGLTLLFTSLSASAAALELEATGSAPSLQGPKIDGAPVFAFEEELVKTRCKGSVRLVPCQTVSKSFHNQARWALGRCFADAAYVALGINEVKTVAIHGEVFGSGRTGNGYWRLHNWRRAVDIYKVVINSKKTMNYSRATRAWQKEDWDSPDYRFWREFRNCWGDYGNRSALWFKDNRAHWDHIHISTPYSQPWSYFNSVSGI